MDAETADFCSRHARDVVERYEVVESAIAPYFALAFPTGCRVLDVTALPRRMERWTPRIRASTTREATS